MILEVKRGSTVLVQGQLRDQTDSPNAGDSAPLDIRGWEVTATLRNGRTFIAELEATLVDFTIMGEEGFYELVYADTHKWPLTKLSLDVRFAAPGGTVLYTDTFTIAVVEEVTQASG